MSYVAKLDEYGKGAWIALMILGFALYWPIGLAVLGFTLFSGRFRAWKHCGPGRWYNTEQGGSAGGPWGGPCSWGGRFRSPPSSGNRAFDDYRAETLKRLEEEQREFMEYLERLRQAKDKQEFDQFMAELRNRPGTPAEQV